MSTTATTRNKAKAADLSSPPPPPSASALPVLEVERSEEPDAISLTCRGTFDLNTLLVFRDAAFTAIGARPPLLCLNLAELSAPLDTAALGALVTVIRVARMMDVPCRLFPSADLRDTLRVTGMERVLPIEVVGETR